MIAPDRGRSQVAGRPRHTHSARSRGVHHNVAGDRGLVGDVLDRLLPAAAL